jgi:lipoyl(octanoyl) transferase
VLRDPPAPAAWNMAVDEALLLGAAVPTLRLYGWQPHAVSLGWFQRRADFADLPPGTDVVRRLTGGGAIHHGNELTFALALPAATLPTSIGGSYARLHDAVVEALADIGVACQRLEVGAAPQARPQDRWCFAVPGRDDLVTAAGKLLGSAQRRIRHPGPRVLHHGSLVLERPALTPFVAAVADAIAVDSALRARLERSMAKRLALALGLLPAPGTLTASEATLARRLVGERYAAADFTDQR